MSRMVKKAFLTLTAFASVVAIAAAADNEFNTPTNLRVSGEVPMCLNGSSKAVPCSTSFPLAVSVTGGSGGGGDASATNQVITQGLIGALTETAPGTDTASSGLNGRLQRVAQRLTTLLAVFPGALGTTAAASSFAVALSTEDVARQGSITETAPATDTASSGLNGRLQRVSQRLTSVIALLPTALGSGGGLKVDGSGTALPVSAASLPLPTGAATEASTAAIAGSAVLIPTAVATNAITPVVSTAAEGSHVIKASAGNLYSASITTGAVAGYLMIFNATSAPADGAVTPQRCWGQIAANSPFAADFRIPESFSTGITAVFSSTGCFVKTISATAFIAVSAK